MVGIVKEIINCETNTKFVLCQEDGLIVIPDVIFYVLTEGGEVEVIGSPLDGIRPEIASDVEPEGELLSHLDGEHLEALLGYYSDEDFEEAGKKLKKFVKRAKKLLPYLDIEDSAEEFLKENS